MSKVGKEIKEVKKAKSDLNWYDWFKGGAALSVLVSLGGWGVVYTVQQALVNTPMQMITMLLGVTTIYLCVDVIIKLIRK